MQYYYTTTLPCYTFIVLNLRKRLINSPEQTTYCKGGKQTYMQQLHSEGNGQNRIIKKVSSKQIVIENTTKPNPNKEGKINIATQNKWCAKMSECE